MMKRAALWIAAAAIVAFLLWTAARAWRPDLGDYPIHGVDVGAAQGTIDWPVARAGGVDFAYLVATDGIARDSGFEGHWSATKAAGMRRGAMHVWSLCANDVAQTTNFLATVPRDPAALPAALVLGFNPACATRPDPEALLAELRGFLTAAETHLGKPVMLKVTREFDAAFGVTLAIDRDRKSVQSKAGRSIQR